MYHLYVLHGYIPGVFCEAYTINDHVGESFIMFGAALMPSEVL